MIRVGVKKSVMKQLNLNPTEIKNIGWGLYSHDGLDLSNTLLPKSVF